MDRFIHRDIKSKICLPGTEAAGHHKLEGTVRNYLIINFTNSQRLSIKLEQQSLWGPALSLVPPRTPLGSHGQDLRMILLVAVAVER